MTNWFTSGGAGYAAHRPTYPPDLARRLAELAPARRLAVDVGCGSGQFTALLAEHVDRVIGLDPSADQLAHAAAGAGVEYRRAAAEQTGLDDACADLITVAQAAHWLDLPPFYDEVRRIAADGAVLALITYGAADLPPDLQPRFTRLYRDELGPYWPPERRHIDAGYADLEFGFPRIDVTAPPIEREWTLDDFTAYLATWSAARRAAAAGDGHLIDRFAVDVRDSWGPGRRRVRWPLTVVAGRVERSDLR